LERASGVEGVGIFDVLFFPMTVCTTTHAGWQWYGDGGNRDHAWGHLSQRIAAHDPLAGGHDYGRFGSPENGVTTDGLDREFFSLETIQKIEVHLMETSFPP
jgi:hypothetical protein